MKLKNKKGQLVIFIIITLVIIGILIIIFSSQIKKLIVPTAPYESVPKECVQKAVENALQNTLKKGGSLNPELYIKYDNETIKYLCYTREWYKTCVMQQPLLKQHIEVEINRATKESISRCLSNMESRLKKYGYNIKTIGGRDAEIKIVPDKISVSFNITMELEKGDEKMTLSQNNLKMEFNSEAYKLITIATSILNWEARIGDSIPEMWMEYYPDLKVEKKKQTDGSKIYIITDRASGLMFRFATRSLAWPPGLYL